MEIYRQSTGPLSGWPWDRYSWGEELVMIFSFHFPNRGEFIININSDIRERLDKMRPPRAHIWMAGEYDNPDLFVAMLTPSPRIEDFDLLRLRKKDEVW